MGETPRHSPSERLDIMAEFPHIREKALGKKLTESEAKSLLFGLAEEQDRIAGPYEQASDPDAAQPFRETADAFRRIARGDADAPAVERAKYHIGHEIEILERKRRDNPKEQKRRDERWRNLHRLSDFIEKK